MVGRSKVWRLARFTDDTRVEVECSLCPVKIKYVGNTTNIARHLELRHPVEFAALDPMAGVRGGAAAGVTTRQQHQHYLRQPHQRREEAAICRILAQHQEELRRQESGSSTTSSGATITPNIKVPNVIMPTKVWTWHIPVQALPTGDDGGGGSGGNDYSHNNGDEAEGGVGSASSPVDQYQGGGGGGDGSERDPTPAPPTPTHQKPESYQLRHNNHLTLVLEALARDESFMDVTLTAQGRSLKAHKSVLSAVSPYFRGVLRDNPCQHPIIIMPRDVRFEELYSIVNYIYKGEMTVAAEDLTSLLKTAEILQVSGLAPSDSTATLNPSHQESSVTGNPRSSSTSSSASSTSAAPPAPRPRPTKQTPQGQRRVSTPPPRPKSGDSSINPTDFMDVDMTCVKEEVTSGGEEDDGGEEQISKLQCPQSSPGDDLQHTADALHEAFSLPFDQNLQQPLPSTSSSSSSTFHQSSTASTTEALDPSAPSIKSDPDHNMNPQPCTGTIENAHPFRCPHCEEQHRDMDTLLTHLRLRHPTKPSFTCGCGRVFTRQTYQQAHSKLCPNAT